MAYNSIGPAAGSSYSSTTKKKNRAPVIIVSILASLCLCAGLVIGGVALFQNSNLSTFSPVPGMATRDPGSLPAPTEPPPTNLSGTVTLWYSLGTGSPDEAALNAIIDNAEASNPGLFVDAMNYSYSTDVVQEYLTNVAAGSGPDLILADSSNFGKLLEAGAIIGLPRLTAGQLTGYQPYALDGLTADGRLYGLPQTAYAVALYYNKSMVPEPPATTDDLMALVSQGQVLDLHDNNYFFFGFFGAFGGELLDENGHCIADQGGFAPALDYFRDLNNAGAFTYWDYGTANDRFMNRESAITINGTWALADYESALGADLGLAPLPFGPAGPARPLTSLNAYFVNPNSLNPETATALALILTSRDSVQLFVDQTRQVPARTDVTLPDPLLEGFAASAANGVPYPANPHMENYWGPFTTVFDDVLNGYYSSDEAVRQACQTMNTANGLP